MKTIDQVTQMPMDCWQVAEELFGKIAVTQDHFLAGQAAQQMKAAGWKFSHYNDYGEEVYNPPIAKIEGV